MTTPLLTAAGLHFSFGGREILSGLDLALAPGDEVALLGRSGSGKTTLLLALAGLLSTGAAVTRGQIGPQEVGVIFQSPSLIPELSALENVMLPLRLVGGLDPQEAAARGTQALAELGLAAVDALPAELSGGQQQRVAVARVIAGRPRVLLADEPTGALDPASAQLVLTALRRSRAEVAGALLIATHDLRVAEAMPRRLQLDDGQLQAAA